LYWSIGLWCISKSLSFFLFFGFFLCELLLPLSCLFNIPIPFLFPFEEKSNCCEYFQGAFNQHSREVLPLDFDHLSKNPIYYLNKSLRAAEVEKHSYGFRVAGATQEDSVVLELVVLVCQVLDDHEATDNLSLLEDSEVFDAIWILSLSLQGLQA
jgi:hypothetical protein